MNGTATSRFRVAHLYFLYMLLLLSSFAHHTYLILFTVSFCQSSEGVTHYSNECPPLKEA
uniref:Uncharacterized protein n=1 Tax=Picea sitchensis TaxID=3332 RepID=A0A6B9XTL1_PICSI|nr:hypothetical protein Q903MT_gene5437 [Picea sitchensis]